MVNGYCRGCKYLGHITSGYCCEYLAVTGTARGCPAGKGCVRREMGGRMPSLAALQTVGKAPPKLNATRERETWEEMYERERARKARAAIACAERCKGRQRAAIVGYLAEKKMTMKQLSDLVGASPGTVGKWCAERANANWEKLARVGIVKPEGL